MTLAVAAPYNKIHPSIRHVSSPKKRLTAAMAETSELIHLLRQQIANQESRHQQQMELMQKQVEALVTEMGNRATTGTTAPAAATPRFAPFDSTSELWAD
ncbi:hypothetical protein E2C01_068914 [Portunus trituberculatus]|uniref:Uncharacterized protein n=1 Tax=Portunus trituberculatus TaxID=210409 RepID=A0A5B7HNP8_PORTR|nr:hypothetical protein [Portunus trituberculatus]